jgi:ankyrin repeat protein
MYLLQRGASVHNERRDGVTVLIAASVGGQYDTIKALVDAGADVRAADHVPHARARPRPACALVVIASA